MDLTRIGTPQHPLRASALTGLAACPGFMLFCDDRLGLAEDEVGAAAHTGTAVGRMIELYHSGLAFREALDAADSERGGAPGRHPFPLADMESAEEWFHRYVDDPRNPRDIVIPQSLEGEVRLELPPAPEDPTQQSVLIVGHLDQIRVEPISGEWRVWDVKSGRSAGLQMLYQYAWQLAAYALAASETYGRTVRPGGIIRLRGYTRRSADTGSVPAVFFEAPWSLADCADMMSTVAQHVAWLRGGLVHLHPGLQCQWCPAEAPHLCGPRLTRHCER